MAEAIIVRKGGSGSSGEAEFRTELIGHNCNWVVPKKLKNNAISVRIFGGGAAGSTDYGGGSGWMNNAIFTNLTPGQVIPITVGRGGLLNGAAGGMTTFGSFLSANGGSGRHGGSGGAGTAMIHGGDGYQFGGGSGGGNGGKWGGGGGADSSSRRKTFGGDGGEFGGGGGGYGSRWGKGNGGNGGLYGGGGGGAGYFVNAHKYDGYNGGIGGTYGGNGEKGRVKRFTSRDKILTPYIPAEDGINTSTWTNVFHDGNGYFRGWGKGGKTVHDFENNPNIDNTAVMGGSGGGGYGGNGGTGSYFSDQYGGSYSESAGGGGGGYGSNGGNASASYGGGGGGGGGFGGDGGDAFYSGGGGGGYGKSAHGGNNGGGGGGYYGRGGNNGGGGGGYGNGGDGKQNGGTAAGGGVVTFANDANGYGGDGICIIQYYI